jgi:alkanesulfonate monooxygenase SsuD/methylene tetrahydromethanopterin reductase-like flavin-dependent oxidoreductase (luciferase family)
MLKYGYFANIHDATRQRDYGEMVAEMRELAAFCDEAGFETFWIPEHHFSVWGREMLGNPILMGADLAARTTRIRIGLSAVIITLWHPLRVAEDLALLDHLAGGRLEVAVGRGNYGLETSNLNPAADPNNPAGNLKVFLEALAVIKKALSEEKFSHKGELFQFPAPGFSADKAHSVNDPEYVDAATGELAKLTVFPRPKQKPMPPMWQVISEAIEGIRFAAADGMGVIMWRPSVKELRERLRIYKESYEDARGESIPFGARTAIVRDTFLAESEAEARRIVEEPMMSAFNFANWRGPRIFLDPGETLDADTEASLRKKLTYDFVRPRALLIGSPDEVVEQLVELHLETSVEQVIFKSSWPGVDHRDTMRSMRLLVEEVLPKVQARVAGRDARTAVAAE